MVDRNDYHLSLMNSDDLPEFIEEIVRRRRAPHGDDRGIIEVVLTRTASVILVADRSSLQLMRFFQIQTTGREGREERRGPNAFSSVLPDFLSSEDTAKPYTKGFPEVWHYLFAMQYMFPSYRRAFYDAKETAKVSDWNDCILRRFGLYWENQAGNTECR